jgi:hypothetical protein
VTTVERPAILDRLHDAFVVLLVVLRPLCWDGAPGQPADLIWQALAIGALLIVAIERAALLRPTWTWSWRGVLALTVVLAVLPAVLAAPEPAPAWSRWTGWVSCLAAAAYLSQVLPGRMALLWASLGGGLLVTALFGVMQPLIVLPAMAAAQQTGSSLFDAMPGNANAISERIANGGAFATFTLANQFGSYLALVVPLMYGLYWSSRGGARWVAALLVLLGGAALFATGAKGAWLALAAGAGFAWWLAWHGRWWRWLPIPLGACAVALVLLSGRAAASIDVRVGYWRSAAALVAEAPLTGHGLGGFAAHQPRVMQAGDEPTRFAHNEVLEAAVAGGLPLAALLAAGLVALAWPRRGVQPVGNAQTTSPPAGILWVIVGIIPYLALLHAFDGNLGWWPGGGSLLSMLGWAVLLGACSAGCAAILLRAGSPPGWTIAASLLAVALKALIDFDLHAAGIVGTALLVAVAAGGSGRQAAGSVSRWLPSLVAIVVIVVVVSGMRVGLRLAEADDWIAEARQVRDPQIVAQLRQQLDVDPATPPGVLAAEAALRAWALADGAPGRRLAALELLPAAPQTLDMAHELALSAPSSAAASMRLAMALTLAHAWSAAIDAAEQAVGLSPTAPRTLLPAADILQQAADALPARSVPLRDRAGWLRSEAARLEPLVHPSMRAGS